MSEVCLLLLGIRCFLGKGLRIDLLRFWLRYYFILFILTYLATSLTH